MANITDLEGEKLPLQVSKIRLKRRNAALQVKELENKDWKVSQ